MSLVLPRRPWRELSSTAPSLPGGGEKQVATLLSFLRGLDEGLGMGPANDAAQRDQIHKQIGPLGLTHRVNGAVELTSLGRTWLMAPEHNDLFQVFHSQIAYFGEMLATIASAPMRPEDLLVDAVESFRMSWTSLDQVRRRLMWLHALGLVEDGPSRLHRITDEGAQVLKDTAVETADTIRAEHEKATAGMPLAPAPAAIAALVASSRNAKRSLAAPYLTAAPVYALIELASETKHGSTKDSAIARLAGSRGISESSAKSFVDTAGVLGLYEYTGRTDIRITALGLDWLEDPTALNFVRILHTRYFGVGEVLRHINATPRSSGEIHTRLFGASGGPKPNRTTAILRHLVAADAVAAIGFSRYVLTDLGAALREELPLDEFNGVSPVLDASDAHESPPDAIELLAVELEESSRDSSNPSRFERACAAAFSEIGVEAEHLGGPGRTDVLVTVKSSLKVIAKAIVDAKSAAAQLTEGSVKFEALKEHATKHGATLMAVVAPDFEGSGRLGTWARSNGVVLLTASDLGGLLRAHRAYPFSAEDVKDLLTVGGREAVDARHAAATEHLALVTSVMRELSAEASQDSPEPVAARDIGRIMRRSGSSVSDDAVRGVLELLSQPAIGAVRSDSGGLYTLPSAASVAATRLRALARSIDASIEPTQ